MGLNVYFLTGNLLTEWWNVLRCSKKYEGPMEQNVLLRTFLGRKRPLKNLIWQKTSP